MRTLTYGGAVSLDGFLAGTGGALDWLHFSKDVQQIMAAYWKDVDTNPDGTQNLRSLGCPARRWGRYSELSQAPQKRCAARAYLRFFAHAQGA